MVQVFKASDIYMRQDSMQYQSTERINRKNIFKLILFALVCTLLYYYLVERTATVRMEVYAPATSTFKMYWQTKQDGIWSETKSVRVFVGPDTIHYAFNLTRLGDVSVLRIDTSEEKVPVIIRTISIYQAGYKPIHFGGADGYAGLKPGDGILSMHVENDGLVVAPSTKDPQLLFDLPGALQKSGEVFLLILLPMLLVFTFVFVAGLILDRYRTNNLLPLFMLIFVLALIMAMASISQYNAHPDEIVHVRASEYFQKHFLPPVIGTGEILDTYSVYGVSRLHSGEIAYLFLGKFAKIFRALPETTYLRLRFFNICLWMVLVFFAFQSQSFRIIMLPALLTPQVWYIFSYVNSEAFAVFIMMLAAYQVAVSSSSWNKMLDGQLSGPRRWLTYVLLGLLFGLLLLLKKNFYIFILFAGFYFLWRLVFGKTRLTKKNVGYVAVVLLIGGLLFGLVRGGDEYINGFKKDEKLLQARYQFAGELWNPGTPLNERHAYLQMRERGTDLKRFLTVDHWGGKSYQSSFGVYGFTSVLASLSYYNLVEAVGILLLLSITATMLLHAGLEGVSLWLLTLSMACGLIGIALYHAWTVDFQSQGRYFLPIIGMFAIFYVHAERYLTRSFAPFLCGGLFLLSAYSFIFVGLAGIAK